MLPSQRHIADRAETLIRGLATVGIFALVDEATGYQKIRAHRAPGVLDELRKKNPTQPATKTRKQQHHQWFTPNFGHPKLKEDLAAVTALMGAVPNWGQFQRMLDKALPYRNYTLPLSFDDEGGVGGRGYRIRRVTSTVSIVRVIPFSAVTTIAICVVCPAASPNV